MCCVRHNTPAPCYAGRSERSTHGHIHNVPRGITARRITTEAVVQWWWWRRGMGLGTDIHYQYRSPPHQKREQGQQCHHRGGALNNPDRTCPLLSHPSQILGLCLYLCVFIVYTRVAGTVRLRVRQHNTSATSPNSPRVPDGGNPARTDVRARTQSNGIVR